jgi:hypothetical protein
MQENQTRIIARYHFILISLTKRDFMDKTLRMPYNNNNARKYGKLDTKGAVAPWPMTK